ncbi:hypothetical protein [Sphingomonas sp. KR3-1]|uniref:hypothetical protein n=1 Tax=Sphingomonas sp. KR3-1 TaxID=3156611 RepID=UPI0032B3E687
MSFTSRGILADAVSLWRAERELLVALGGLFFVVPVLGAALLLARLDLAGIEDSKKLAEVLTAFYDANLLPLLLISVAIDFGSFAVFNLFLQGGGRTLGEVLLLAIRRFPGFFALSLLANLAFSIGSWLILPALFVLARTWLAGPAYAAQPGQGILGAFRAGWDRSTGLRGFVLLGLPSMLVFVALMLVILTGGILGTLEAVSGAGQVVSILSYLVTALIGGGTWLALAVIRVAAYRLSAPK